MADKDLIVNVSGTEIALALLEDKRLIDFKKENRAAHFQVGDVYLGKVRKLLPELNAAFINVGHDKDAFLHYQDLGANFPTQDSFYRNIVAKASRATSVQKFDFQRELPKDGFIANTLTVGQTVIVQIAKESISTKGPRLTSEISLSGRNLVLIPFSEKVSVSTKIESNEEKNRLRTLILSIKPKHYGVIVRTAAEGKRVAVLDTELRELVGKWEVAFDTIKGDIKTPRLFIEEVSRSVALLRDMFDPSFNKIYVNDNSVADDIRAYLSEIAPGKEKIVTKYSEGLPIFEHFGISKQIKSLFGRLVPLKRGVYLVIEHTEALHVIDVNSGSKSRGLNQELSALEVNIEAAQEIARQIRLRDMGGIIIIDFIDMVANEHRQQLYDKMKEFMESDRSRHNILPLTKFGLMQITRQRVRPVMNIAIDEVCPDCLGKGTIRPSILFCDELEEHIEKVATQVLTKHITLHLHPYVAAYVNKGIFSLRRKWNRKFRLHLKVVAVTALHTLEYHFFDRYGNEIDLT